MTTAAKIAAMLNANVRAVDTGVITWEQFSVVNRATWELADRGEPCVIGTPCARRMQAVHKALRAQA